DERRQRQREADVRVSQVQLVADLRPRGVARAEDELVEELDREQDCECGLAGRPGRLHLVTVSVPELSALEYVQLILAGSPTWTLKWLKTAELIGQVRPPIVIPVSSS